MNISHVKVKIIIAKCFLRNRVTMLNRLTKRKEKSASLKVIALRSSMEIGK